MTRPSVAIVTNIPRPYRQALFSTLSQRLAVAGFDLQVLYTSDPAKHVRRGLVEARIDGLAKVAYVPGVDLRLGYERVVTIPVHLRRALDLYRPACVISGGLGLVTFESTRWCRRANVPHVVWSGGWLADQEDESWIRSTFRERLVAATDAFVTYGSAAADYLVSLGADPHRIFCAWNTVDLEGISSAALAAGAMRTGLTSKHRLAERNLLFLGSLVDRKGLRELLAAALTMRPEKPDWAIHLVGDGPLRNELEMTVRSAGMQDHFRFHGLRTPSDVAELLGLVDGLVLPTKQEVWGLVINEAMACGVPVVASYRAGATRDLIENGITGYVVDPDDTAGLAAIMSRLLAADTDCKDVGRAGAVAVRAKASLERSAEGFVEAVRCALAGRPRG